MPKFNKKVLNEMLERIIDEFFDEKNQSGMWEVIEYVKGLYSDEIDTLDD